MHQGEVLNSCLVLLPLAQPPLWPLQQTKVNACSQLSCQPKHIRILDGHTAAGHGQDQQSHRQAQATREEGAHIGDKVLSPIRQLGTNLMPSPAQGSVNDTGWICSLISVELPLSKTSVFHGT